MSDWCYFTMTEKEGEEVPRYVYKGESREIAIVMGEEAVRSGVFVRVWVCEELFGTTIWRNGHEVPEEDR